jgi:hypothetical protein
MRSYTFNHHHFRLMWVAWPLVGRSRSLHEPTFRAGWGLPQPNLAFLEVAIRESSRSKGIGVRGRFLRIQVPEGSHHHAETSHEYVHREVPLRMEQHHKVQPSATWLSRRFPQMASRVLLLRSPLHQVILILQPIFRWELILEASLLFWYFNAKGRVVYINLQGRSFGRTWSYNSHSSWFVSCNEL